VKTGNISCATRVANALGCGIAVREYSDLSGAQIIILKAPDDSLSELLSEMAESGLDWTGRTVMLFDSDLDSSMLAPLEHLGAFPASLSRLHDLPDTLLAEGHPQAVRCFRRSLRAQHGHQLIEIRRGCKAEYLAGVRLGTTAFLPTVAAAIDHFCSAGIPKAAAEKTAASLFEGSIRAYFRAGKRLLRRGPRGD
jgi:hypothetical protein